MNYINLTPHATRLNDGREFAPHGVIARVSSSYQKIDWETYIVEFGQIQNLPEPQNGLRYIVSALVEQATWNRPDVVSPATGHPECIRQDGQIFSVPGFVKSRK